MSADNGIYILRTSVPNISSMMGDGFEYRIAHLQAVENYQYKYCDLHGMHWSENCEACKDCVATQDPDIWIKNAREMWKNIPVFHTRRDALNEADRIYQEIMQDDFAIIEYGISFIDIPRVF